MKKRIVIVALLVCILVLSIASTTIAYFTDTKAATNTFTVGEVKIKLTETAPNGTVTEIKDNVTGFKYEDVFPTQKIAKNPTIVNASDKFGAYVGAVITITVAQDAEIKDILANEDAVKAFLGNLVAEAVITFTDAHTATVKIIKADALAASGSYALFDNVVIPAEWNNAQMAIFAGLTIKVDAYATQVEGLADGTTAMQAAFDVFD